MAGKREKPWYEAEPVPPHTDERAFTQAILRVLAREEAQRTFSSIPRSNVTRM
jgi:hypothetical protein